MSQEVHMRWQHWSHVLPHSGTKRWPGLPHHEFTSAEIHALIGVGALLVVGMLLMFIAWGFW